MRRRSRDIRRIILGVFVLFLLASVIESASPIFLLGIGLLLYFWTNRTRSTPQRRSRRNPYYGYDDEYDVERAPRSRQRQRGRVSVPDRNTNRVEAAYSPQPVRHERSSSSEQIHDHALEALRRAGLNPERMLVIPTDIGMISFSNAQSPQIYRVNDIPDDVDYVQPYVELRLNQPAMGTLRFEITDSQNRSVFLHEEQHDLRRGRNLITPAARLPVHDELTNDEWWNLKVYADGLLLAHHRFGWEDSDEPDTLNDHVREDGEISNELRAMIEDSRLQPLSLDDLLGEDLESGRSTSG